MDIMRLSPIIVMFFFSPIAVFAINHEDYGMQVYVDFEKFEHRYYTVDYPTEWLKQKVIDCHDYVDEQTCNEYIEKTGNDEIKVDDKYMSRTDSAFARFNNHNTSLFHIIKYDSSEPYEEQKYHEEIFKFSNDYEVIKISGRTAYKIITTDFKYQNSNITEIKIDIPVGYSKWSIYTETFDDKFLEDKKVIEHMINSFQLINQTPYWVIDVAELWCNDTIGDNIFIPVIKYLNENDIIIINRLHLTNLHDERPDMLKQQACEWASDPARHIDFMDSMKFYIIDEQLRYN